MGRCLPTFVACLVLAALVACGGPSDPPTDEVPLETETPAPDIPTEVPPSPIPISASTSTTIVERYTVRFGDTLGGIAQRFDVSVDDLVKLNGLANPHALQAGQVLKIAMDVPRLGPTNILVPDSEAVYSPSYQSFDTIAFASQANGYLVSYREKVEGDMLSGPEIIQLVAERYSVGPRVLLALLEFEGGWVTLPSLTSNQIARPLGYNDSSRSSLFIQASWAANRLNEGYYGKLSRQLLAFKFKDGSRARIPPSINAGTAAVENALAQVSGWDAWSAAVSSSGYLATYRRLFGDPNEKALSPLIPARLEQPPLRLPWANGSVWYYTGGPHSGWGDLAAWAAIDVTPGDLAGSGGCYASREWTLAAAPGKVIRAEHGRVIISLSNTNFQGNGWALMYMHIAAAGRVGPGVQVKAGDPIGHPSCEGGAANASHAHIARLFNGQWIGPDTVPFVMSGWTFTELGQEYEGKMVRGQESREACDCRDETKNAVTGEDIPR